jgi:hypothetical protein
LELPQNVAEVIVNHEVSIVHINTPILPGRISAKGPELRCDATGTPYRALVVETDKAGADGQVDMSFHKVEIIGRFAEALSVTLEPGLVGKIIAQSALAGDRLRHPEQARR